MGIGVDCVCSFWFLRPDCARSLLRCLCLLQSLCHALSTGVSHNATVRMAASPISVPCRQPDLGVQFHSGQRLAFGGSGLTLFKGVSPRMRVAQELLRGLGILVHPSPPVQAYLWTTSLGRIFPGLHTG